MIFGRHDRKSLNFLDVPAARTQDSDESREAERRERSNQTYQTYFRRKFQYVCVTMESLFYAANSGKTLFVKRKLAIIHERAARCSRTRTASVVNLSDPVGAALTAYAPPTAGRGS
ncbi:hypothetical protein EVAR_35619_1 [Eumeta japonica]|uniref:Uncharacterized protein n=1 Tax=Eumeta variegata TaxID=151549 RepID=A0A4C1WC82_EUMVA|nr:hypothetical protein EVAR_35619_1 [Eumeta japonica]